MKIEKKELSYLSGEKFDDGYCFVVESNPFCTRIDMILSLTKNKKVLHVGCCDHQELIMEKIEKREWLHGLLRENCQKVIGVDINKEAIDFLNENGLGEGVFYNNIVQDEPIEEILDYDYILLGEMLEHIDNPVDFLIKVREKYCDRVQGIIITVPNALNYRLMQSYKKHGIERVNSDHLCWYTPYTLLRVVVKSGILPTDVFFVDSKRTKWSWFCDKVLRKNIVTDTRLGQGLVCIGNLR